MSTDLSCRICFNYTGRDTNAEYYARVNAENSEGTQTAYVGLGGGRTKPAPVSGIKGVPVSAGAILWSWDAVAQNLDIEVFASSGGALSGVLVSGATQYLQAGLSPNVQYGAFVRVTNRSGFSDSLMVYEGTLPNAPASLKPFSAGDPADVVIGQSGFTSSSAGGGNSRLRSPNSAAFDSEGNLWVSDSGNFRVVRFPRPLYSGMSADMAVGQADLAGAVSGVAPDRFAYPAGIKFDKSGNLWVADSWNSRVLRFPKPFSTGMPADRVVGQTGFYSAAAATSQTGLRYPSGIAFDGEDSLWVSDTANNRVLRFTQPVASGMGASIVLGQIDFNTLWYKGAEPKYVFSPPRIDFDRDGALWVADYYHGRAVKFSPPFNTFMAASSVLGQPSLQGQNSSSDPSPSNMMFPTSVVSVPTGEVYVVDGSFNRATMFSPPITDGMSASVVIGQSDFQSGQGGASQNSVYVPKDLVVDPRDNSVWVVDNGNNRVLRFSPKTAFELNITSASVRWGTNSNPPGTLYSVGLSTGPQGLLFAESPWVDALGHTFTGLLQASTYFAYVKAKNMSGSESEATPLGAFVTNAAVFYSAQSTVTVNDSPELEISAVLIPNITLVDTASSGWGVAIGSATSQGITLCSNLYEIGPEGVYDPPATLTFYYSTATLKAAGLEEEDAFVYEHFPDGEWKKLPGQVRDPLAHKITVPITQVSSLFGIFGIVRDRTAPVTEFSASGSFRAADGMLFVSTAASLGLTAADPVVYGTSSGVAFTEFRVNMGTSAPFATYAASFVLPPGAHALDFRSVDNAGNVEVIKSTSVFVDGEAPFAGFSLAGASYAANGVIYAAADSTVMLSAIDAASGVGALLYSVNGATFSAVSTANLLLPDGGAYSIAYSAVDNVGNAGAEQQLEVIVDTSAPVTAADIYGAVGTNGWHVSPVDISLRAGDDLSGVKEVLFSFNGSPATVYASSFTIAAEGSHGLAAYSVDNLQNKEAEKVFGFKIDTSTPGITYDHLPAVNADGWNKGPVEVIFAGADVVSGIDYCSSTFTLFTEGKDIPVSGYCRDFAGWSSTAAFTVSIDTTPPTLSYVAEPAPNAAGWNNSDATIMFACFDGLSGIKSCPADIVMAGEGVGISTTVAAVDYADNSGIVQVSGLKVDKMPPVSTVTLSGGLSDGWYSSNVQIAIAAEDFLSGVKRIFYSLDNAAEMEYTGAVAVSSEGWHSLRYYAEDAAGNKEAAKELAFAIDGSAPEMGYLLEPLPNAAGWNKGSVRVVFVGTDTLSGMAGCSTAIVDSEGRGQQISGSCRDVAGNISYATATVNIDLVPPVVSVEKVPAPNVAGWNNSDVTVKFTCTDALSGVKSCPAYEVLSGEGVDISTSTFAQDYADNSKSMVVAGIKIDKTMPAVVVTSPAAGVYAAGKDTVNIGFSVADNLDQVPSVSALLVQALDKGTPRGERPASVNVADGQALDPMALDDGLWRLEVLAVDAADNSTRAVSGLFEVVHDTSAPLTTLSVGEPKFTGEAVFINSTTPLLLSATDDMLVAGDRQGVGVELTYASIDGGAAAVVTGPLNILSEGTHTLAYYSVDRAGNAEPAKTAVFSVDNSAPEAAHTITGPVFQGGQLFVSTSAMIGLSAVEPPSSGAASGLSAIFVADSTDTYAAYAGAFTAAEGAHLYNYYAKDRLGNTSQAKMLALVSDGTPPATELSFSLAPSTETANRLTISSNTYVWLAGTDAYSGIAVVTYSIDGSTPAVFASSFTLTPGPHSVAWWSVDNVGNAEPARTAAIQVRGQTGSAEVIISFEPSVINLKSEGKYVEARLTVSSAAGAGFGEETIRITKVNGVGLLAPLYALDAHAHGRDNCDKEKGGKDKDKCGKKSKEKLFSVTVKFDRQALLAVLPPDAVSVVTVEGSFDDSTTFIAEDSLRVITPGRIRKGHGGKWKHRSRACADLGAKALKEDTDISVLSFAERFADRLERDKKAFGKGLTRRGEPFEFGPEGTVFEEPVEISLPYETYDAAREKLSIAYWNPSSKDWEPLTSTLDPVEKVVKAKVGHFSLYQVLVSTITNKKTFGTSAAVVPELLGPSAEFLLGEVYVYPNPAKGGAVPVFHMECGIADTVDIKIYTVSGREAHEVALTGTPAIIDDGNGGSYAYEYAWRGHIPSGVYLYYIEARKGGQKIKKTGKFAVVR